MSSAISRLSRPCWSAASAWRHAFAADELREALVAAYNTNPTIQAARAQQRATDEGVPDRLRAGVAFASAPPSTRNF
jgi:outer membrane protein